MSSMGLIGTCNAVSPVLNPSQLVPTGAANLPTGVPRLQRVPAALIENRQGLLIHVLDRTAGGAFVLCRFQIDHVCRTAIGGCQVTGCHLRIKVTFEGVVSKRSEEHTS